MARYPEPGDAVELAALREFADWLIEMDPQGDEPVTMRGRENRQTVTLTKIIEQARAARQGKEAGQTCDG